MPPMPIARVSSLVALPALCLLVACGGSPSAASPATASATAAPSASASSLATAPADAGASAAADGGVQTPDTPAGHQLAWVLEPLQGGPLPAEGAASLHFTPEFLAQVPASKLLGVISQLAAQLGSVTLVRIEDGSNDDKLSAILQTNVGFLRVRLAVEAAAPFRMRGLIFQPATDLDPVPASWSEVETKLTSAAPEVGFLAASIGADGTCTKIDGLAEDHPLAIGSAFKLYILAALARQIAAGKHSWTETLAIDPAKKSLPSGEMQDAPDGTTFTLQKYAEKMISISDNTAADHLLALVGRDAVEAEVKASGNTHPELLTPFLSTREIFDFKLLLTPAQQHAYIAATVPAKRKLLLGMDKGDMTAALAAASTWKTPRFIDSVEWRVSPNDLCKIGVVLKGMAAQPATAAIADIMSINPGIPDPQGAFKYVGFKGGSEPGVMALAWVLQRAKDGAWVFLAIELNDPQSPIDEAKGVAAAQGARAFLAK